MKKTVIKIVLTILLFGIFSWGIAHFLTRGMMRQYGLTIDSDILILGHSHIMLALDKEIMQKQLGVKISKYTREGVTVAERNLMAGHYLRMHPATSLQCVIYGVDPYLFTTGGLSQNSYINFLPFMQDPEIEKYIRDNASFGDYWRYQLLPLCRFSDNAINAGFSGWFRSGGASLKTGKLDVAKTKTEIANGKIRSIEIDQDSVRCFQETVEMFTSRGIKVILLNTPIIDLYNQLDPELHQRVDAVYKKMAEESPLIEYLDLNPDYEKKYELFRDPIHLNRDGQKEITNIVVAYLQKWKRNLK